MNIKLFDVFYRDNLHRSRGLVVEIYAHHLTLISESGGESSLRLPPSKWQLMDLAEWEKFADHMSDDITPREMREYKEAARGPFEWPKVWREFKERYETTGNAYLGEPPHGRLTEWSNEDQGQ